MRTLVSGLIAAAAALTVSAAPASACGGLGLFSSCSPCGGSLFTSSCGGYGGGYGYGGYSTAYTANVAGYGYGGGCGGCASVEQLPELSPQYYHVNQGPTYTGPGNFAPYPTYQESAISTYGHRRSQYGYDGDRYADAPNYRYGGAPYVEGPAIYRARPQFRSWRPRTEYRYQTRPSVRYGYAPRRSYAPRYSLPPRQFYAPSRSLRYGAPVGAPRYYGRREQALRRYY
jgi:hypothetical protein